VSGNFVVVFPVLNADRQMNLATGLALAGRFVYPALPAQRRPTMQTLTNTHMFNVEATRAASLPCWRKPVIGGRRLDSVLALAGRYAR
jgi:hypothetical protein